MPDEPVAAGEPVAIVGMACRFPGAEDLGAYWRLLVSGRDAIGDPPPDRAERRRGGYLDDVASFDAAFFGMPSEEARRTDPQQRLLLELTWHALEDARIDPLSLRGSATGVFVGATSDDYAILSRAAGDPTPYTMPGTARAFLANRISHVFGLRGASLVVDTGPSSVLAALHQAVRGLRAGEIDTALVGGVQLNLTPHGGRAVEALGVLSAGGRCRTFDAGADGIVRGEGGGVLVLRRLRDVSREAVCRQRVYCSVLACVLNNDGGATGLTTPSDAAQRDLLARACRAAGVAPAEVGYVELHGSATPVGDPVEASALGGVLGAGRPPEAPLLVGSAKTNIGHLEGAAGAAGLIKTALSLHHGTVPPSLHHRAPNPAIDLAALRLRVCTAPTPWPAGDGARIAGVSAFGLGGTNGHAVLARTPAQADPAEPAEDDGGVPVPVVVSGPDAGALRRQAARLADAVEAGTARVQDVGLSSATTRAALRYRAALVAATADELVVRLRELADGTAADPPAEGEASYAEGARTVFVFPGQGTQRAGMGRRLHKEFAVFARAFDEACAALEPVLGADLKEVLWDGAAPVDRSDLAQTGLFALEVALYRLLESWGILPDLLIGHSRGEISAAHLAGLLSLEDAAVLAGRRGLLIRSLPPGGAMIAVQAAEDEARAVIDRVGGQVGVAAVNSPGSLVVSGAEGGVQRVADHFAALGRRTRRLRTAVAGHSPLMDPIRGELRSVAEGLTWRAPAGPLIVSTVTGRPVTGGEMGTADYWVRHLTGTVRFGDAVRAAHAFGARFYVEMGPGQGLTAMIAESVPSSGALLSAAPLAAEDELRGLAETAARAFVHGVPLDWPAVYGGSARTVDLPLYGFARERHWLEGSGARPARAEPAAPRREPEPRDEPATAPGPGPAPDPFEVVVRNTLRILGRDAEETLDLRRSFNDLGLDSLMAVQLRDAVARATGRAVPATLLFDHPTPGALIEALRSGAAEHERR